MTNEELEQLNRLVENWQITDRHLEGLKENPDYWCGLLVELIIGFQRAETEIAASDKQDLTPDAVLRTPNVPPHPGATERVVALGVSAPAARFIRTVLMIMHDLLQKHGFYNRLPDKEGQA